MTLSWQWSPRDRVKYISGVHNLIRAIPRGTSAVICAGVFIMHSSFHIFHDPAIPQWKLVQNVSMRKLTRATAIGCGRRIEIVCFRSQAAPVAVVARMVGHFLVKMVRVTDGMVALVPEWADRAAVGAGAADGVVTLQHGGIAVCAS